MKKKTRYAGYFRQIRENLGLTQEEFAARLERSVDAISNIERGKSDPNTATIRLLASQFHIPLNEAMRGGEINLVEGERDKLEKALLSVIRSLDTGSLKLALDILKVVLKNKS